MATIQDIQAAITARAESDFGEAYTSARAAILAALTSLRCETNPERLAMLQELVANNTAGEAWINQPSVASKWDQATLDRAAQRLGISAP